MRNRGGKIVALFNLIKLAIICKQNPWVHYGSGRGAHLNSLFVCLTDCLYILFTLCHVRQLFFQSTYLLLQTYSRKKSHIHLNVTNSKEMNCAG